MKDFLIKLSILLFIYISLIANNYPSFSKKDFIEIQKKDGRIAKNRAKDYQETINSFKKYSKKKQLGRVNFYLNQLLPQYDSVTQEKEDYWETPKEFLMCGYGDCEDYAIIKYFTLLKLGFHEDKLFITHVKEKFKGGDHMVLSYFNTKCKPPLILDNLSFKILDLDARDDLRVNILINNNGVYKMDNNNCLIKIQNHFPKFDELMRKIRKEH